MRVRFKFLVVASFIILALSFTPSLKAMFITTRYLSAIDPAEEDGFIILPEPITDPVSTSWLELYPDYPKAWHLLYWYDDDDGELSRFDKIDMEDADGQLAGFHVDRVTVTIHFGGTGAEPDSDLDLPLEDPTGTQWHMIYYSAFHSRPFEITAWYDSDNDGTFNLGDRVDVTFTDTGSIYYSLELVAVSTDIVLTQLPHPVIPEVPLGTIMASAAMIVALVGYFAVPKFRKKQININP